MISRRARAKCIAILCALGAIPVCVIGIRHGIRHVRETRAIEALRSEDLRKRKSALEELGTLQSVRAVPDILSSVASRREMPLRVLSSTMVPGAVAKADSVEEIAESWEELCGLAIRRIGVRSVPVLRSKLASPETPERLHALRFLWRLPELAVEGPGPAAFSLLDDPDGGVREEAARALGAEAPGNPRLLERLAACLKRSGASEQLRVATAQALATAAVPPAMRESSFFEKAASEPEGPSDPESPEDMAARRSAALALLEGLYDPSVHVRGTCLRGVCRFLKLGASTHADIRATVQDLLHRWLTDEASNRSLALGYLDDAHGTHALPRDVLTTLGTLLADADSDVRRDAAGYLRKPEAVPVLMAVLEESGDTRARDEATDVLESLSGANAWSAVFDVLERPDGSVRQVAVDLLSSMGQAEAIGVLRLSSALESREPPVRRAAARILAHYHKIASLEAHGLFALLHDDDEEVLSEAAAALSFSGNLDAEVFESRVLKLLDVSRPVAVREAACRAARGLGPRAENAVPRLVTLLDRAWDGRAAAAEALGAIGPAALAGVPALLAATNGVDADLAAKAVEALARISLEDAIAPAVQALAHESGRVRDSALAALWSLGSDARPALPALRKLADQEKDLDLATRAITLVGRIEVLEALR